MANTTEMIGEIVDEAFENYESYEELDDGWAEVNIDKLENHRRAHSRRRVNLPVIFKVILENGLIFTRGKARVKDISPAGALIEDFEFTRDIFPTKPFKLSFKIIEGIYDGVEALCEPVRFAFRPRLGIGLRFDMLSVRV